MPEILLPAPVGNSAVVTFEVVNPFLPAITPDSHTASLSTHYIYLDRDFFRAPDTVVKRAISDSRHRNVEVAEWFPSLEATQRLLGVLDLGKPKLSELNRLQKMEAWLSSQ